jgi:peptidoglycan/xylan/chitin deacetylase (PgdA/CDA1 family)
MNKHTSFFSQLYHLLTYPIKKPKMQLEKGMLIISIDVDVGSRELGVINKGKNDANVHSYFSECRVGEIDERAFPLFVSTFDDFEIPVTFAMRGQLTELNYSGLELLLESSVKHDIGAHGYYHRRFTNLSHNEAENELNMISTGMKKFGIIPRSFVFPRGSVAHLNLLEKYGYLCYRGYGDFKSDRMYIEKQGQIYNVHPSLCLDQGTRPFFLKKILDISISRKLPFHVWFNLWNFGETKEEMQKLIKKVFVPLFNYAKGRERSGEVSFETMVSVVEKVEKLSKN